LGPAQCYSTNRVSFRPRQSLLTAHCSDSYRRSSPSRCRFPAAPGYCATLYAPHRPREMHCRPYPLAAWLHQSEGPLFFLFARLCSLLRACSACHHALCCRQVHRHSSTLRDAAPQAGHRVARRPINRHHRPLLRPVTNGSPLPELPQAPPRAPLPPIFLQPSHHPMRSPPTHRPSTARQQPPSTCGPRCRRRAYPPDRRHREQPDSGEDSHF
jgi:hypothetical protein